MPMEDQTPHSHRNLGMKCSLNTLCSLSTCTLGVGVMPPFDSPSFPLQHLLLPVDLPLLSLSQLQLLHHWLEIPKGSLLPLSWPHLGNLLLLQLLLRVLKIKHFENITDVVHLCRILSSLRNSLRCDRSFFFCHTKQNFDRLLMITL